MEISIRVKAPLSEDFLQKLQEVAGYEPYLDWEDDMDYNYFVGYRQDDIENEVMNKKDFKHLEKVLAWLHVNLAEETVHALGFDDYGHWATWEHFNSEQFHQLMAKTAQVVEKRPYS